MGELFELLYVALSPPLSAWLIRLSDGRRPVYLISIVVEAIGSAGVAFSRSVPELLVCRVVQAFGASSGLSVGQGVIGDIYKLEERGTASGIFFAVRPSPIHSFSH